MSASSLANTLKLDPAVTSQVAHPLYPVEQVFLWLPGFRGTDRPHCTYNAAQGISSSVGVQLYQPEQLHDTNGASYSPLFPINQRSYICWHLHVSPPTHFHGVPITRTLSAADMGELAQQVLLASAEDPATFSDLLSVLCNDRKCYILASLSLMGLLSGSPTQRTNISFQTLPEAGEFGEL